jgi:hypothetical protein
MKNSKDPNKLSSYWKTPFRQVYSETFWQCIKSILWCHIGIKFTRFDKAQNKPVWHFFCILLPLLALALFGCASLGPDITAFESEADQLAGNVGAYIETIANALQTDSKVVATGVTQIASVLQTYGLLPTNSTQSAVVSEIENVLGIVSSSASATESLVATMQSTGVIPTPTTTATTTTLIWKTPAGVRSFTINTKTHAVLVDVTYSISDVTSN